LTDDLLALIAPFPGDCMACVHTNGRNCCNARKLYSPAPNVRCALADEAQADALRLLDASRNVVNQTLTILWPHLDEFGSERPGSAWKPAWKQVGKYTGSPDFHGDRQWRCEGEVVGRLLRQQAERKKSV
jgi:hypothetical protein